MEEEKTIVTLPKEVVEVRVYFSKLER